MPSITIIPASTPTGTGFTLQRYYRRLADELGMYLSTSVTAQASVGEATRLVLSNDVRDDEDGYMLTSGRWLYVSSGTYAQTQRRIVARPEAGYQGPVGAVMVSRPFSAALTAGTVVEMTSPLPVRRHLGVKGLVECVNEALMLLWTEARLVITGNGTYTYDLAGYPWLTSKTQTLGIEDTAYLDPTYPTQPSPWDYDIRVSGADHTLVTEKLYSSAETFTLKALVRGDRLVYDGTAWAYRDNDDAPGLQGDTWQAAVPEQRVLAFAMVKALQYVTRMILTDKTLDKAEQQALLAADILPRRQAWARAAAKIKLTELPVPPVQRGEPLVLVADSSPGWI